MKVRLAVAFLAAFLVAADSAKEEAAKRDLELMKGNWTLVSHIVKGKPATSAEMAQVLLTVQGKNSTLVDGKVTLHGIYILDPTKTPKTVDIELTDGPDKGKKMLGLYLFEKGQLKFSLGEPGAPRPNDFKANPKTYLEIWQHAKPVIAKAPVKDDKKPMPAATKPAAPVVKAPPPFSDKNLEAAVRAALHEPTADLTDANLLNVYILEATDKKIANLKGLDKCKNLALVKLTKNQVSDLAPLRELTNLQSLDLAENNIVDISALAGLNKLQYLELSKNHVAKIDAIAGMTALNSLYLGGNQIVDLTPTSKLSKLWTLSVPHNLIKEIGPVAALKRLSTLDLSDNQVSDLKPLSKFSEISLLILERNKISDLTPLIELVKTDAQGEKRVGPFLRLYLGGNALSESTKAGQLQALKSFGVRIES